MKNLIIQYYIDTNLYTQPNFNNLGPSPAEQYSSHSFQVYCKKYSIDYIKITKPKLGFKHPTWERFDLWLDRSWWDRYDQIMYVDSDVFALPHAPDIFKNLSVDDSFKSPVYRKFRNHPDIAKELSKKNILAQTIPAEEIAKKFIQPGVFILNKKCTEIMLPHIEEYKNISDNSIDDGMFLNYCLVKSEVPTLDLNFKYNVKNNAEHIRLKDIYFLHCAGGKKHRKGTAIWKVLESLYPEVQANYSNLR